MTSTPMTRRQRRDAERAAQRAAEPAGQVTEGISALPQPAEDEVSEPEKVSSGVGNPEEVEASAPGEATEEIPATTHHARPWLGRLGRAGVLAVLAATTVIVPLTTDLDLPATAHAGTPATTAPTPVAEKGSVTAELLGTDADVDESSDAEISNVPDAATLARIREAYTNAKTTCAAKTSGASGDASAFDEKPTLFMPMVQGTYTVSSPYGYRIHPTLGYLKLHTGQDYAARVGTPIYAAAAGTVVKAGMVGDTGTVVIKNEVDGKTWYTAYLHMYADGIYVREGQEVKAGELIAGVGSTGRSTGPHLHFEVRTTPDGGDENTTDPAAWLVAHHAAALTTDCQ